MPPWLIPLLISGGSILSNLFEKKPGAQQFDRFTPEQQAAQNRLLQMFGQQYGQGVEGRPSFRAGESYLTNLLSGDPSAFQNFEEPFKKQYFDEVVPALAERFTSLGAQRSSGFQNALAKSGADLSSKLASLRGGLQMQALPQALNYAGAPSQQALQGLGYGLQPSYDSYYSGQQGPLSELLGPLANAYGQGLGYRLGGGF
jgi:hypothetical protein